jgi:hypothetical protein
MTTLKAARAATTTVLSDALATQTTVYGYEARPGGLTTPTAVTVATAGITDTDWQLVVRVYVTMRGGDFAAAQDTLDDLTTATDTALDGTTVPRSTWQVQYVDDLECLVASTVVSYPRDDWSI